jgi:hypothetical protein
LYCRAKIEQIKKQKNAVGGGGGGRNW